MPPSVCHLCHSLKCLDWPKKSFHFEKFVQFKSKWTFLQQIYLCYLNLSIVKMKCIYAWLLSQTLSRVFSSLFMILPSIKVILPLPLLCITIITHAITNTWREISTLLSAVLAPVLPAVYPTPILLTFGVSFTPTFIPHSQKQIFQICEIFWTF